MDSETVVAAGPDTTSTATSPSGFVTSAPSLRVRALPSFEDDDDDNDITIDDINEGGVAEESGKLTISAGSSSFRISNSAASVSEEEEGEGGFVSGEEEFDTASERPYVAEDGGLDKSSAEEEEDVDVAFAEPPESLRPIAKLSEDENDDEVELNTLETGGDGALGVEDAAGATKENGAEATSVVAAVGDASRTELASSEKPVDADGVEKGKVDNGVEDAAKVPETSISNEVILDHGIDNGDDNEAEVLETSNSSEVVSEHRIDNVEKVQTYVIKPVGEGLSELDEVKSEHGIDNVEEVQTDVVKPMGEGLSEIDKVKSEHGIDNVEEVQTDVVKPVGEGFLEIDEVKSEHGIDNVEEVQTDVVKPAGEGLSEVDEVNSMAEGDSVVESINVDVNVAEPGVAIVEDVKPAVEASLGAEKPVEDSVATKVEEREVGERESDKQVEIPDDGKSVENVKLDVKEDQPVVVPPSNDDSTVTNGLKVTSEGDVVVETIQVDLQEPGVVVVNGSEETTKMLEVEEKDIQLDRSLPIEESSHIEIAPKDEAPVVGGEGDSVKEVANVVDNVDEIKVSEIKGEEILINGRSTELEEDKPVTAKPEHDAVMADDLKFTIEGDSVVVAAHQDVSELEMTIVKDSKEGEKPEAEVAESLAGEAVELNNVLDQTSVAANDAKAEDIQGVRDVSNAAADEKIETAGERDGRTEEVDEVDLSARGYDASVTEDFDQEENADDEIKRFLEEARGMEGSATEEDTNGMIFGSSEAAEQFLEELEQQSTGGSQSGAESSHDHSQMIDGQIVTDSDEEVDTDEEESGKELFDSAALAALLKAATGGGSDGVNVTLSSQDVSNLFSVERPAGLGSSLRARSAPRQAQPNLFSSSAIAARGESESNLSEEERKKLESIQQLRVKFLRLVHRLGQSSEDSIAAQVLYRLVLVAGRPSNQAFSLDAAKKTAQELESQGKDDINFSLNILVIGKSGVGKSATINSIFGENKAGINAFEPATTSVKEITGVVNGVQIRVFDTPGLKTSVMDQATNRKILASVKKATKKCPPDIVLYVDRLDSQTRDLNDLPLLRTITSSLGASIWRSAIVTLTHAASAPPDGPSGAPLSYEVLVAQRSHAVQQSIGQAVGDLRLMNPSLMNPVSLAENHPSCRKNRDGQKVLPNGQTWRPQLLMFCYSMKILSEASALHKQKDPFDHQKLFGFRVRAPPLPYLLSWLLQSRTHPKLSADQGGDNGDSDIDLDGLSESEGEEEEDEYDQLPPFKPLRNAQLAKLNKEQLKAYYEEYDYRVKLLQKKQWKEELKRMKDMKKGKVPESEFLGDEADPENGAPAAVPVPMPDMVLPPSFDCDNPAYRYRFLEPSSQFLARPVLDNHGWDHDCGYDGVNVEQSLAIASRFPAAVTVQLTKDKKEFNFHLDSSVAAKHGENASTMAGFDIQNIGKKMAYIVRGETKFKNLKKNKTTAGFSVTFLGENVATGVKIEDQIPIGKRLVLVGSTGTVRSQNDAAYGANLEVKLREADFPIGQDQSSLGLSLVKWRGDLALGANLQSQFSIGRGSKVAVRLGLNNKNSGQITVRTSTSDQLQIALVGIIPVVIGIYRAIMSGVGDNYGSY